MVNELVLQLIVSVCLKGDKHLFYSVMLVLLPMGHTTMKQHYIMVRLATVGKKVWKMNFFLG